jgi:hypothetical protein
MIMFEEYRVPYEMAFVMRAKKEALVRSLLRQYSVKDAWVLRCVSHLMLDFDVRAPDLWECALKNMHQLGMWRSLSRVLNGLCQYSFVRGLDGASDVWEKTLLSPLHRFKALTKEQKTSANLSNDTTEEIQAISLVTSIRFELELMVTMLQKCPFLDQIDVAAFVVHLRDLTLAIPATSALASVDLHAYAVRCALVIPRPSARFQALQRIVQSGAYMQVLEQVCDAAVLNDEPVLTPEDGEDGGNWLGDGEHDDVTEQLALLQAIFTEATKRGEQGRLLGTSFEPSFLEFLAATSDVDFALSILYVPSVVSTNARTTPLMILPCYSLHDKRLEAASTLVELLYESHPDREPNKDSVNSVTGKDLVHRWTTLRHYVAASTSHHLTRFRDMTS